MGFSIGVLEIELVMLTHAVIDQVGVLELAEARRGLITAGHVDSVDTIGVVTASKSGEEIGIERTANKLTTTRTTAQRKIMYR